MYKPEVNHGVKMVQARAGRGGARLYFMQQLYLFDSLGTLLTSILYANY